MKGYGVAVGLAERTRRVIERSERRVRRWLIGEEAEAFR